MKDIAIDSFLARRVASHASSKRNVLFPDRVARRFNLTRGSQSSATRSNGLHEYQLDAPDDHWTDFTSIRITDDRRSMGQ